MSDPDPTYDDWTPINTNLSTLDVMTTMQRERLAVLIRGFKPYRVTFGRDRLDNGDLLFTFYDRQENVTLHGLIEPTGEAHT